MKKFFENLLLIAMLIFVLYGTTGIGPTEIAQWLSTANAGAGSMFGGINWLAFAVVLIFGLAIILWINAPRPTQATEQNPVADIDYSVPRFLNVKVVE
jgi:hypothetical protein